MKTGYTYDDVLIVPKFSNVAHRAEVDLTTDTVLGRFASVPILSANMKSVTEVEMALAMDEMGGVGVLHRFAPAERLFEMARELAGHRFAFSFGTQTAYGYDTRKFVDRMFELGADFAVLDVAHGHHEAVFQALKILDAEHGQYPIMVGNIVTAAAARSLISAGANGLKVGLGNGSLCTTRNATGVGVPQLTAVMDVVAEADKYCIPVCADGGIKAGGDIVKALAAGASTVMVGGLLAATKESAASYDPVHPEYKFVAGNASGTVKTEAGMPDRYIEGIERHQRSTQTVREVVEHLLDGVRSGASYVGASDIEGLFANAEFVCRA